MSAGGAAATRQFHDVDRNRSPDVERLFEYRGSHEMAISLSGKQMYLWRAVDGEGEVLAPLGQAMDHLAAILTLPIPPAGDCTAEARLLRLLLLRTAQAVIDSSREVPLSSGAARLFGETVH
jgi:hypothetical protein